VRVIPATSCPSATSSGAEPVVVDVYDAETLREAVVAFDTDLVMHQLTDLPDDASTRPPAGTIPALEAPSGTIEIVEG
jgi:hypothetical protein